MKFQQFLQKKPNHDHLVIRRFDRDRLCCQILRSANDLRGRLGHSVNYRGNADCHARLPSDSRESDLH